MLKNREQQLNTILDENDTNRITTLLNVPGKNELLNVDPNNSENLHTTQQKLNSDTPQDTVNIKHVSL